MIRNGDGVWVADADSKTSVPEYLEALVRYLNIYDPIFASARRKNEFYFLSALFAIRGLQDAGWNPYETTLRALRSIGQLHNKIEGEAQRNLQLWLYGHISEASEPYELIGNLLGIANGEPYLTERYPDKVGKNGKTRPFSIGEKVLEIERLGTAAGFANAAIPLREIRDRELRNAIFHSDYAIHGTEVRIRQPYKSYSHEQIALISNRALAYLESISALQKAHRASYSEPKIIETPPEMGAAPTVVLVARGKGAIGLQAALTKEDVKNGHILWRMALLTPLQRAALHENPFEWSLPSDDVID